MNENKKIKILRLKIYQPHVHYRIPFTFSRRHTYPIPPYSTIIGLISNVLGINEQSNDKFRKLKEGLSISIFGKFESMIKEYIWFRNLSADSHNSRFGLPENRFINQMPEHPGGQIPIRIDVLENVNLIIYIYHLDENFLNDLVNAFKNPKKRIYPLHLGRAEDLIIFDGAPENAIKVIEIYKDRKQPFYGILDYFTWIPDPFKGKEFIDETIYDVGFNKFYEKLKGSNHLITSFYEIREGFRNFMYVPVKLFEQGDFPFYFGKPFKFITDEELGIPLFLCKMIYPESKNGNPG